MSMHTIDLAYVGRGLHEELAAYIADQQDYYAEEGVHVALRDGCTWDVERLRRCAIIGLGRALLSRLTDGTPWVALSVNTQRPLFWFLGRPGLTSLADLAGRRLAVHAPHTPPGAFARIVLRKAGLDPDRDVKTIVRSPGDYRMDLRRLNDGSIDAAYVGSTMAPEAVAAEHGWNVLAWVGDHFRIPTVGVAVDPTYIRPDDPAVQAVVRAHRRALSGDPRRPRHHGAAHADVPRRTDAGRSPSPLRDVHRPVLRHRRPGRPRRLRQGDHRGRRGTRRSRRRHRGRVLPDCGHHSLGIRTRGTTSATSVVMVVGQLGGGGRKGGGAEEDVAALVIARGHGPGTASLTDRGRPRWSACCSRPGQFRAPGVRGAAWCR